MSITRITTFFLLVMMFITLMPSNAAASEGNVLFSNAAASERNTLLSSETASERNIYVGDIIELKISSQKLTEDIIRDKFKDFEIVGLTQESDHFIVKLRTFDIGEKRVVLGDKEIVIVVKSALEEIQSEGPMEGGLEPEAPEPTMPWLYIFIALLAVFVVTGAIFVKGRFVKKSKAQLSPYQRFLSQSGGVSSEESEFLVKQTCFFKEYLEAVYQCKIKGMTSSEIMITASRLPRMQGVRQDLEQWLKECDFFKFSGATASRERKQEMQRKLAGLVGKIDAANRAMYRPANGAAGTGFGAGAVAVTGARAGAGARAGTGAGTGARAGARAGTGAAKAAAKDVTNGTTKGAAS